MFEFGEGDMILGADQDSLTASLDEVQYFKGDIANLNMWGVGYAGVG